jgi:hypothetical protein
MKRLQIMIEEDLDADMGRQAAERGVSKAALIRETMRDRVQPLPPRLRRRLLGRRLRGVAGPSQPFELVRLD